jgi:hypothetical protein
MSLKDKLDKQLSGKENKHISDKEFLEAELAMGVSSDNPAFVSLCNLTAQKLLNYPEIKSVLDYGAGTGVYSNSLYERGFDVKVYEIFNAHQEYIKSKYPHLNIIDKPVTTDCLFWIEVSEHMTDEEIDNLFDSISPTYIYHSSTSQKTEHDEKWGHINIKSQEDWIKLFERKGYELIRRLDVPTAWSKIFKKI